MKLIFFSMASGSSGNCYYLGTPEYGILIDAGISIRTIKKVLKDRSVDMSQIMGVLVTQDGWLFRREVEYPGLFHRRSASGHCQEPVCRGDFVFFEKNHREGKTV